MMTDNIADATQRAGGVRQTEWPAPKIMNPDIPAPTGVPYIDSLIHQLLDAQQDLNLEANERMSQPLCDASALIEEAERALRIAASLSSAPAPAPAVVTEPVAEGEAVACPDCGGSGNDKWGDFCRLCAGGGRVPAHPPADDARIAELTRERDEARAQSLMNYEDATQLSGRLEAAEARLETMAKEIAERSKEVLSAQGQADENYQRYLAAEARWVAMAKALSWYADPIAYAITQAREPRSAVHGDGGKRAIEALRPSGPAGKGE